MFSIRNWHLIESKSKADSLSGTWIVMRRAASIFNIHKWIHIQLLERKWRNRSDVFSMFNRRSVQTIRIRPLILSLTHCYVSSAWHAYNIRLRRVRVNVNQTICPCVCVRNESTSCVWLCLQSSTLSGLFRLCVFDQFLSIQCASRESVHTHTIIRQRVRDRESGNCM